MEAAAAVQTFQVRQTRYFWWSKDAHMGISVFANQHCEDTGYNRDRCQENVKGLMLSAYFDDEANYLLL